MTNQPVGDPLLHDDEVWVVSMSLNGALPWMEIYMYGA